MKPKFPKDLYKRITVGPKAGVGKNRNRSKCVHYIKESHLCQKLNIGCVGPSNSICQHYSENSQNSTTSTTPSKESSRMLDVVNNNTTVVLEQYKTHAELVVKVDSHTYESHKALLGKETDDLVEFEGKIYTVCEIHDE